MVPQNDKQVLDMYVQQYACLEEVRSAVDEELVDGQYISWSAYHASHKSAKNDCQLFSRLYIGCQNRGSNLDEFFTYENQVCPPTISDGGRLRHL